mgnify:FL=1
MQKGLTAGIINPGSEEMMKAYRSYLALMNFDPNCEGYIAAYAGYTQPEGVRAVGTQPVSGEV